MNRHWKVNPMHNALNMMVVLGVGCAARAEIAKEPDVIVVIIGGPACGG